MLFNDYIEYFKNIVLEKNIQTKDIIIDNLNSIKEKGENDKTIESLDVLHMNLYRNNGYKFLDYFNYRRCIEYNLPLYQSK